MNNLLKFSKGESNAKLKALGVGKVYTFSISSGWSCPGANECLGKATPIDGTYKMVDGPKAQFRCFSATQEVAFPAVRLQRQHNFDLLRKAKTIADMYLLISQSLPADSQVVRVHVGGDFFNKDYMAAWFGVAKDNPEKTFYAYTKSLNYWVELMKDVPANFKMNASKGGRHDALIDKHNLKYAKVVYTEQEAIDEGLEIDHDDRLAIYSDKSFALLLHGVQKKGSAAAKALKELKGVGSYGKGKTNKSNTPG